MVGSGVFTTSGFALAEMGSREAVLLVWLLGAVHAAFGFLCYGWMAQLYPESGGEYLLLTRALHPSAGYVAGWVSILAGFTAPIAATAHGVEAYLQHGETLWLGALVIVACVATHSLQRELGANLQTWVVGLNLSLLFALTFLGGIYLQSSSFGDSNINTAPTQANWSHLGPTFVLVSYSYLGWNGAIYLAGELRSSLRKLTLLGVGAVCVVATLYLGLNAVFLYAAPTGTTLRTRRHWFRCDSVGRWQEARVNAWHNGSSGHGDLGFCSYYGRLPRDLENGARG